MGCNNNNIKIIPTQSPNKAMVCERFNKTLKIKIWRVFTHNSIQKQKFPQNYKIFLQDIFNSYNNSYHRSIKTEKAKVNKFNEALIYEILSPERAVFITFKYQIGDYVRIVEKKPTHPPR
jgi:hypothetical protein